MVNSNKRIFVCSPLRGDVENNLKKARGYCKMVIQCGYAPFAPHLIYPQFLNDDIDAEREAGINAGLQFLKACDELWFFGEPITEGMRAEMNVAVDLHKPIRLYKPMPCSNCGNDNLVYIAPDGAEKYEFECLLCGVTNIKIVTEASFEFTGSK